jgi:hypothetical protein
VGSKSIFHRRNRTSVAQTTQKLDLLENFIHRSGLNTRWTWRFNALMTPIRANIVGPPDVATRITASRGVGRGVMAVSELAPFYRNARQRWRGPRALAISARGIGQDALEYVERSLLSVVE